MDTPIRDALRERMARRAAHGNRQERAEAEAVVLGLTSGRTVGVTATRLAAAMTEAGFSAGETRLIKDGPYTVFRLLPDDTFEPIQ